RSGAVGRGRPGAHGSEHRRIGGSDAECLLRAGTGRGADAGSLRGTEPPAGEGCFPLARPGHAVAVRPAGAAWGSTESRSLDRLSDSRPAHAALAPGRAPGERNTPRPAARPIGTAAGIPRLARIPTRRQPALDSLANDGPARQADGQGIRAAERA